MIEVDRLSKRYGDRTAIDAVSFTAVPGQILGFLGPNGAGKTTTMRIITGYLPATAGTVRVAGFDVFEQSIEVRRRVGYLPESAPVYAEMGIVEYLRFVAEVRGIPPAERAGRIDQIVQRVGLIPMIQKDIGQLSKGYRQRVGLAATLIHDPEVLVLDEPTSGLDPNQIIEIRQLIRDIGREKTVILSTHILPEVEATCNRVLIINGGRIVASGTPEELTKAAAGEARCRVSIKTSAAVAEPRLRALSGLEGLRPLESIKAGTVRYELHSKTEADIEELRRRQQQGEEFDDRLSFGDYYKRPPRRRRRRRPRSAGKPP